MLWGKRVSVDVLDLNFLLLVDPYHKQGFQLDVEAENPVLRAVGLTTAARPSIMEYDYTATTVYWYDQLEGVIKRKHLHGLAEEVVVVLGSGMKLFCCLLHRRCKRQRGQGHEISDPVAERLYSSFQRQKLELWLLMTSIRSSSTRLVAGLFMSHCQMAKTGRQHSLTSSVSMLCLLLWPLTRWEG